MPTYFEFFCGGGMARAGLGPNWRCRLANDIDPRKAASYALNFGADALVVADVGRLSTALLAERAQGPVDLAWASFPCQDLSLAGAGAGLAGARSGAFWSFWRRMEELQHVGRAPRLIALENVCGALTSHGGRDFRSIFEAFCRLGYKVGAVVIDAAHFLPQSRPRLFIIGVREDEALPAALIGKGPNSDFHPPALCAAAASLADPDGRWIWWNLPSPVVRRKSLKAVSALGAESAPWHSAAETRRLIAMMNPANRAKLEAAKDKKRPVVGAMYRRTRYETARGGHRQKVQRVEVRFDGVAGCLRTPAGGSSRQLLILVDGARVKTRLLQPREAARLMGLAETYRLPPKLNDALHLLGDGVAAPVVAFLARSLFEPILDERAGAEGLAA